MAKRVGEAFIGVTPSFRGFRQTTTAFVKTLKPIAVPVTFDATKATVMAPKKPVKVGVELDNGAFDRDVRRKLQAALSALPPVRIGAESSAVDQEIKDISARLAALSDKRIGIDIDDEAALAEVAEIEAALAALDAQSPSISVRTNIAAALAQLAAVSAAAAKLDGKDVDLDVKADTGRAFLSIKAIENRLDRLARGRFLINVAVAMAPLASPIGAALAGGGGGLLGIGAGVAGAGAFAGFSAASMGRVTEATEQNTKAKAANAAAAASAASASSSAAAQVVSAERAVADAQDRVAESMARLHDARRQAIRDLNDLEERSLDNALSIESADISLIEAKRALAKAERDDAGNLAMRKARLAVAEAEDRLSDAKRQAARDTIDLAREEKKGVDGSDRMVAARQDVADAEQSVADAQAAAADAGRAAAAAAVVATAALVPLSAAQQKAADGQGRLSARWNAFLDRTDPFILGALVKGMDALGGVFRPLEGYLRPVAGAVGDVFDQFGRDVRTPAFGKAADELGVFSGPIIRDAAEGTSNLATGFWNLLKAFMPLSTEMSGGLVGLTDRFAAWTAGLEDSEGFQSFVDYVRTNGPVLLSTLGGLFLALVDVGVAVAPLGEWMLGALAGFAGWLSAFAQTNPKVVQFAVGILVASRAVAAIATVFGPVLGLFRIFGSGLGLLVRVGGFLVPVLKVLTIVTRGFFIALLSNPIGIIITALVALGVGLVVAYKKSETFRRIVDRVFSDVKAGAGLLWEGVKWAFDKMKDGLKWLGRAFGEANQVISRAFAPIVKAITDPLETAKRVLNAFFEKIDSVAEFFGLDFNFRFDVARTPSKAAQGKDRAMAARGGQGGRGPTPIAMPARAGGPDGRGKTVWPANTKTLSSNYAGHSGIDIAAAMGSPIMAASRGTVEHAGWGRGYGNAIFVRGADGLLQIYGHASATGVRPGQSVIPGQILGRVGSTGNSTGPHLHFEIAAFGAGAERNRAATLSWLGGAPVAGSAESGNPFAMIGSLRDGVKDMKNALSGPLLGGIPDKLGDWAIDWAKDKVNPFDWGGIASTAGPMMKATVRPERVLSPAQTRSFEQMVQNNFTPRGGDAPTAREIGREVARALDGANIQTDGRLGRLQTQGA